MGPTMLLLSSAAFFVEFHPQGIIVRLGDAAVVVRVFKLGCMDVVI
jgi:hypothetical protein